MRHRRIAAASLLMMILCQGCNFIGGYDARSMEHLTSLKAQNLKLIDDNTEGDNRKFDAAKLEAAIDSGKLKFQEAIEYAKVLGDKLRVSNLDSLDDTFDLDTAHIKNEGKLLTAEDAKIQRGQTATNYDEAIRGEKIRHGGPSSGAQPSTKDSQ